MCSGCEAKRSPSLGGEKGYFLCCAGSVDLVLLVRQDSSENLLLWQ